MKKGYKIGIATVVFLVLLAIPLTMQVLEKTRAIPFIENETLEFTSNTSYALSSNIKGEIKSIKITGKVIGDGEARVLLGDKIIFDEDFEMQESDEKESLTLTGNVIDEGNETNTTQTNETIIPENTTTTNTTVANTTGSNTTTTNTTVANTTINTTETTTSSVLTGSTAEEEEEVVLEEEIVEEEEEVIEEENETNVTQETVTLLPEETPSPIINEEENTQSSGGITANTIDESIQKEFKKLCKDTCKLKNMKPSKEFVLEIVVENAKLIIYEIEYEIVPKEN